MASGAASGASAASGDRISERQNGRGYSGEVLAEFRRGLAETGFVEGHNVAIEYRWLAGRYDLLPEFIGDLVRRRVSVIAIPSGSSSALAAKAATQTIPIVFNIGSDPVAIGLVASLSHPGKNATGIGMLQTAVAAKRVELLREMVPTAGSIALLVNPANPAFANPEAKQVQEAVRVLGLKLLVVNASTPSEIDAAFATMVQQQIGALVVGGELSTSVGLLNLSRWRLATRCPQYTPGSNKQRRRANVLRCPRCKYPTLTRHLYRAYSQGREARRFASSTSHETAIDHQLDDREGSRS